MLGKLHLVPTGLFANLHFTFYQYVVPLGQSQRDGILVEE